MKKYLIAICVSAIFCTSSALACGNVITQEPIERHYDEMVLADGTTYQVLSSEEVPFGSPFYEADKPELVATTERLDILYKQTNNIDYLSDKGLMLMYLGRYQEAKKIFLEIEELEPNRYATAANLGTTYELLGNNEDALQWIKKAVELNPESHKNSEWIHVNILKAKVKDVSFHNAEYILKTNFGDDALPKNDLSKTELQRLHNQLLYQLNERVHFVEPKNKVVAELLFALADTAFLLKKYSGAEYNYGLAQTYGYESSLLENRKNEASTRAEKQYENKEKYKDLVWNLVIFGFFSTIIGIIIWLIYNFLVKKR